jgi:hypothetical protein
MNVFKPRVLGLALVIYGLAVAPHVHAMGLGGSPWVDSVGATGSFALVKQAAAAPVWVDSGDFAGVLRAAGDLQADIARVTAIKADLVRGGDIPYRPVVIIGTLGHSSAIDDLVRRGKLDVSKTAGQWEAYVVEVVKDPFPGVPQALVIAGADKRGTIYGVYELSEQIGVSPWYWWADVPVRHRDALFVRGGRVAADAPVVKYRGIFLNDEAPALSNWTKEKFGGFNHEFYGHVFELILRLRGNYLWPAMWGSAFSDDDAQNPALADEYGVVIGTSHHEPLMRAHDEWRRYGKGPWDYSKNDVALREFWRGGVERVKNFDKIISIGMRGDGDEAMSEQTNVALLERIVADQRKILSDVIAKPLPEIPQLWALYKEVQGYYERGMRVPDDVTLLWCDDNWGNIRRLPTPAERSRSGGAGVYYHFDYVGGPRNYKWLNTIPITKIWEQMNLAWQHEANRIWIVNVGDLKPMEFPIEFFLNMAWQPARWNQDTLQEYSKSWGEREFGAEHGAEVAALINGYTKLNGRRKPEMLAPDTLSLVNYHEAERVLAEWDDLVARAERLAAVLPPQAQDAFFQLALYPVKASAVVQQLYVAAGLNQLYARQGRTATNTEANRVRALFAEDGKLVDRYHALGGGKWNHMMDQINLGYIIWQQPAIETMPAIVEVRANPGASMAVAIEGSDKSFPSYGVGKAELPPLSNVGPGSRLIEVFNRGDKPFTFTATSSQPWATVFPAGGSVGEVARLEVRVDASKAPAENADAVITIEGGGGKVSVRLPYLPRPIAAGFSGFIEADRYVAIEAPHFSRAVAKSGIEWRTLPDFGRTLGGVTPFPLSAAIQEAKADSPHLEYDVDLASTGDMTVELHCAPSLDYQSGDGLRLAVSFDDAPPQIVKLDTWATLQTWERSVADGVRRVTTKHRIDRPGAHVLKYWMVTPGVVLERLIIDAGGVRPSYLGPLESPRVLGGKSVASATAGSDALGNQLDQPRP